MKQGKQFKRTAFPLSAKSMVSTLLLLIAMLMPQGAWAANHYDAGYESTATTYSAAGIKFKITAVRMYNYQGNNSHFNSNPVVTITAGGHTHTFNLGSLTGESGNSIFYYNGEGNENPYKGSGSFSKRTYEQTVDGIPVKAYFDNQKNEQRVSTNPDKTYKDNGDGSSKWCTADLTIEIGVQTAATVTINGNWRDESDGINKTESYSWPFDIPKHTCNSDIQSATNTYLKSAATCTAAAVYYKSCSFCGAAQSGTFTSGSALGHGSTGYTESYSWTGNAYNDASQDTKACTFTLTCKKCSTKVVNGASLTCTKTAHVDALCTATGSTTYQATGSYTAANSAYNYSKTVTNVYTVAVLGHIYSPGSWSWAPFGHSATCTRTCGRTGCTTNTTGHTSSKSVTLGNGITSFQGAAPTCNAMGMTRYIATATVEGTLYSATMDVIDIAPLGHSYGAGAWSWADDGHSATCTRTCGRTNCYTNTPGHTSSKSVTLGNGITSEQQVAPNCTTKGTTRYTATATVEGTQYSDTKDVVDIAALDHDYSQVVDEDYLVSAATCTNDAVYHEKCSRCTTHGAEWSATGTATGNHSYTNNTLTASPIEDGLYAYACDYGCGTHTDDHIIKDFNGEGNHLELTKNGSAYSTSEDITLADANGFVSPVDFSAPSVTYTRTGIKNQWGTLVVPFDVNGSGDDYDLYKLDQVYDYELTLTKVNGTLAAGTPVLIRLHDDLDGDYSLTLTASNTTVSGQLNDGSEANGLQLVGTYETQELNDYDYFISNNKFWNVGDMGYNRAYGVKAAPFRAYLRSTIAGAKARVLSINIADEDVTAVETLNAITDGDAEYYDMNGRRINSLQKGVNIVKYGNGKTIKVNIK